MKRFILSLSFALALATGSLSAKAHGFHGGGFCGGGWHGGYCGYGGWHGGYCGWYGGWWPGFSVSFGYPAYYSYPAYPYYPYYPYAYPPAGGYYYHVPVQPAQPAQPAAPTGTTTSGAVQTVRVTPAIYHYPQSTYAVTRAQTAPMSQPTAQVARPAYRGTVIEYWPGNKPMPGVMPQSHAVATTQSPSTASAYVVSR